MGLEEILSEITIEAQEEYQKIIQSANLQAQKMIVENNEKLEKIYNERKDIYNNDLKKEKDKLIAKLELEALRKKQNLETNLINDLLQEAYQKYISYYKNNPYKYMNLIRNMLNETLKEIQSENKKDIIEILYNEEDEKIFKELKNEFNQNINWVQTKNIIGGFICKCKNLYIENNLESIFNKNKNDMIKIIKEYFEK